ncbi:MAG: PH domain-containing protein, partial [Dehalococcoidia bacterium]
MNDNPGKDREQPETNPDDLDLDDDELLRGDEAGAEDDVEIPAFLTETSEDNVSSGPSPLRPVPLSSIFGAPPPLFPPEEDVADEGEVEEPASGAPVPLSSIFRDPPPLFLTTDAEDEDEEPEIEEIAALEEIEPEDVEPREEVYEVPKPRMPVYVDEEPAIDEHVELEDETEEWGFVEPSAPAAYEAEADEEEQDEAVIAAAVTDEAAGDEAEAPVPFRRSARSLPSFQPAGRGAAAAPQPQVFTVFKPESSSGSFLGIVAVVFCAVVGAALVLKSFSHDPSLAQFFPLVVGPVLLLIGALFAYWTYGSISLRYVIDRNALTIRWGAQRQIVPLINIERLIPADPEGEDPDVRGVDWPGHHVGKARVAQLGEVLFYSGHRRASDILYVQTNTDTYGISVPDPVAFAQAVQTNQMRGSLFEQRQAVHRDGIAAQSFWMDGQARFLTVVLLGA